VFIRWHPSRNGGYHAITKTGRMYLLKLVQSSPKRFELREVGAEDARILGLCAGPTEARRMIARDSLVGVA
jgi:hypothetical protein